MADHIDRWKLAMMRTGDSSCIARSQEVWFWDAKPGGAAIAWRGASARLEAVRFLRFARR